jgi:PDZ domain-containing protein
VTAAGSTGRRSARRVAVAGGLVFAVCLAVTAVLGTPWVVFSPGPVVNTLGTVGGREVVAVSGRATYPSSSVLDMVTVTTTLPGTTVDLWEDLAAWVDPHRDLEPHGLIYPDAQTDSQAATEGEQEMAGAQSSAVLAAAVELHLPLEAQIGSVTNGAPAAGRLEPGDIVLAVDGTTTASADAVVAAVHRLRPGAVVALRVRRGGSVRTVDVTAGHGPGGNSGVPTTSPYLGIGLQDATAAVTANIDLGQQIGGPSAGTMFALAIVDKLTPGSLAGHTHIAGTGTIADDGAVGVIGGIRQKIAGARDAGATVFLAPAGNCAQAVTADVSGIRIVKISTLSGAVTALKDIAAGKLSKLPTCSG